MSELKFKGVSDNWKTKKFGPTEIRIIDTKGNDIASVDFMLNDFNHRQNQSHAKLIAASPELLNACQKILETDYGCAPSAGYMDELKKVCETAVKKALE